MASKLVIKRGKKPGAAPGTLVHVGEKNNAKVTLEVIDYDQHQVKDV